MKRWWVNSVSLAAGCYQMYRFTPTVNGVTLSLLTEGQYDRYLQTRLELLKRWWV